ncbi:11484_t:CDS:1, partial [Acaulospora morrowiae]
PRLVRRHQDVKKEKQSIFPMKKFGPRIFAQRICRATAISDCAAPETLVDHTTPVRPS